MKLENERIILSEWNSLLKFRRAKKDDTEEIVQLYKNAISKMDAQKINQWDDVYPDRTTLEDDIKKNQMFIGKQNGKGETKNGMKAVATETIILGETSM